MNQRCFNGFVTSETSLIQALESAFRHANTTASNRLSAYKNTDARRTKPPLNAHLGGTTTTLAMLWCNPSGVRKWYVIGVGNGFAYRVPRKENYKNSDFIRDENPKTRRKSYNADEFIGRTTQEPHVQIVDYELGDCLVVATDGLASLFLSLTERNIDPRAFLRDRIARRDWKTSCDPVINTDIRRSPTAGAWHYSDDATIGVIRV